VYVPTTSSIYEATDGDAVKLWYLTQLTGQPKLHGRVLIGEIHGAPAAAISLADNRVVADPHRDTGRLTAQLRSSAQALRALERTPALSDRMRAGLVRPRRGTPIS
jgi:hypothetical protein